MSEFEAPPPVPEPQEQPDITIAPRNPVDSETLPGVQDRLTQLRETPSLLDSFQADRPANAPSRPHLSELEAKLNGTEGEYTPEEAFYLEHGWKAYLREYGERGYSLEDIARKEKIDAQEVKNGIADGTITDPNALHLYGHMRLDQAKLFWTQWEVEHTMERGDVRETAAKALAQTEQECLPLINGTDADRAKYSTQQAEYALLAPQEEEDDTDTAKRYETYSHWLRLASRLAEQFAQEKRIQRTIPEQTQ